MDSPGGGQTKENVSGWTVDTLHAHVMGLLHERNDRYMEKFSAADKAVSVAESNTADWKKANNEWRGAMQDKDKLLMSRQEITSEIASTRTEISILRTSVSSLRNLSLTAILVACAVVTVVLLLLQHKP